MMAISSYALRQLPLISALFCCIFLCLTISSCQSSKQVASGSTASKVQLVDLHFPSDSLPAWTFTQQEDNLYRFIQKDSSEHATWLIFIRAEEADPNLESAHALYQFITSDELVTGDYRVIEEGPVERCGQLAYTAIDLDDQYASKKYYFLLNQTGYTISYTSIHSYATRHFFDQKLTEFEQLLDLMHFATN